MKKIKMMTILGTRPEIIRLSEVIKKFDNYFEHILVHTGQNYDYELNEVFFNDLGIRQPDVFLNAAGEGYARTVGNIIALSDEVIKQYKPEAILVLGDTNSCIAAYSAKRNKVPVFHMEAGNRCFDERVPEEINRKIIDHISDINLPYSSIAREYLLKEGLSPDKVIKTGSPMYEVLNSNIEKIYASNILEQLNLEERKYFIVSTHREENIENEENFSSLINALNSLVQKYDYPLILSTHPRTRNKIENTNVKLDERIKLLKPLGFHDYNKLQLSSFVALSDSGTISEESSILNFRAVNLRQAHERPEAFEEASVMFTGMDVNRIENAINILAKQDIKNRNIRLVEDYSMPNVSEKVSRIVLSYIDYVNRTTWKKYN